MLGLIELLVVVVTVALDDTEGNLLFNASIEAGHVSFFLNRLDHELLVTAHNHRLFSNVYRQENEIFLSATNQRRLWTSYCPYLATRARSGRADRRTLR